MYPYIYITLCVLISTPISAKEPSSLELSREQAIAYALEHNKALLAAKTLVGQARARHLQSGKWNNPTLHLKYASDAFFNNEGKSNWTIGLEQTFPITHRLRILKDITRKEIELAEAEIANHKRLLIQKVDSTALKVIELNEQLKLRQSLLDLNQKLANFIESRIASAEASNIHANQVEIETYAIKQEYQNLENQWHQELSSLKTLLSLEPDTSLSIVSLLEFPSKRPPLQAFDSNILETHPQYQINQRIHTLANKNISLATAERWQDIALEIFYEESQGIDDPNGLSIDRLLGIRTSIPLPIFNQNQDTVEERQSHAQQRALELEATILDLKNTAEALRTQVLNHYDQAEHYKSKIAPTVKANLEDLEKAYHTGQISLTDLFRAQNQQLKLESNYLSTLYNYEHAYIQWRAAVAY